jgi:nicotinate-nucleotide adenylyltransferase
LKTFQETLKVIKARFEESFGQTPLRQRNEDILKEAIELSRFTSMANLKEEHGDLLCSLLMSFQENGWDPAECVQATLAKIKRREAQYKAYGRKLNVAILGGAFDPIHKGHVAIAKFVLDFSTAFDQVWLMPCYKHLYGKKMQSPEHRLAMCRLAVEGDRRIVVSDYEIKNKLGGETYHLAKRLLSEDFAKHQYDFSFVMGMDNANTFDKWQNFEDLERMVRFVIVPRPGYPVEKKQSWYMKPPHMFVFPEWGGLYGVSSTEIRDKLNHRQSLEELVKTRPSQFLKDNLDQKVLDYILKNKLYKE